VTGHFAFGEAEVIADPFGGEPRFDLRYHQIYANNPDGIVAGSQEWSAWSGNLQRGWLGLRPISDVLVRQDPELLAALRLQAEVLMARYRSGDGRGVAAVTATTSCVQDSAQALWTTVELLRQGLLSGPSPPDGHAGGESLGRAIEAVLVPFGIVIEQALASMFAYTTSHAVHPEQLLPLHAAGAAGRRRFGRR
jgi:hypothetical protein